MTGVVKTRDRKQKDGCQWLGRGAMGSYYLTGTGFQIFKMKRVLEMDSGDTVTTT